ncbi:MAG: hypothetical protein JWR07_494 [Nevskia sp.]|nr:hypothetical protein [Nevskia sp.]
MDYARFRSRLAAHVLDIILMIPLIGLMIAIGAGNQPVGCADYRRVQ